MSENSLKWKSKLLSSSIPLEFETAKILTNLGFTISYDYTYMRKEGNDFKEFSTDIKAVAYLPIQGKECNSYLNLLVECKYRDENKKWLFLPDTNDELVSNKDGGDTIREFSIFSNRQVNRELIDKFEMEFPFSLKGVEININSGEVVDKDIRHGTYQLKYALPYVIKEIIEFELEQTDPPDTRTPFLVPILLTNADLYMLNTEFTINKLKETSSIEEIAKKVPYLICYSDIGPDFVNHHKRIFKRFYENNKENEVLKSLDQLNRKLINDKYYYNSPLEKCAQLEESGFILHYYYAHFIVCSFENFESLIQNLIQLSNKAIVKKKRNTKKTSS